MPDPVTSIREPKSPVTPAEILNEELYGVVLKSRGETTALPPEAAQRALIAAEDYLERLLAIRWKATRVFSDVRGRTHATFPDAGVLDLSTLDPPFSYIVDIDEPAYDYAKDFWSEDAWGWLDLSHRPVRDVIQVVFAFPGTAPIYKVPDTWIRIDRKYGRVQLVPSSSAAVFANFNAVFMGIIAGGRGVPQSIYVDYWTGFTHEEWVAHGQDLLQALRLEACFNLLGIGGGAIASGLVSGSLSMDGLSRSRGYMSGKYGPYSGRIELAMEQQKRLIDNWLRHERGVPVVFA